MNRNNENQDVLKEYLPVFQELLIAKIDSVEKLEPLSENIYRFYFTWQSDGPRFKDINIYEVAHIIKQQLYQKDDIVVWTGRARSKIHTIDGIKEFSGDPKKEYISLFKAALWVLEQRQDG